MFDVLPASDLVTQGYGCTDVTTEWFDPACPNRCFHSGIDLGHSGGGAVIFRQPVYVTWPGIVVAVGTQTYGFTADPNLALYLGNQAVALQLDDGRFLLYGHLDQADVSLGERVMPPAIVGLVGSRGNSTAPHLHLEARTDGPWQRGYAPSISPAPYLLYDGTVLDSWPIGAVALGDREF